MTTPTARTLLHETAVSTLAMLQGTAPGWTVLHDRLRAALQADRDAHGEPPDPPHAALTADRTAQDAPAVDRGIAGIPCPTPRIYDAGFCCGKEPCDYATPAISELAGSRLSAQRVAPATNDGRDLLEKMREAANVTLRFDRDYMPDAPAASTMLRIVDNLAKVATEHFGPERQAQLDRLVAAYKGIKGDAKDRDELFWRDGSAWWKAEAEKRDVRIAELGEQLAAARADDFDAPSELKRMREVNANLQAELGAAHRITIRELERAGAVGGEPSVEDIRIMESCLWEELIKWQPDMVPYHGRYALATKAYRIARQRIRTSPAAPSVPVSDGVRAKAREVADELAEERLIDRWRNGAGSYWFSDEQRRALADAAALCRELAQ